MLGSLWLDSLIRATWGSYNPLVLAQLDSLVNEDCYTPKIYRIPDPQTEVIAAGKYCEFGLEITPGSLLYGFLLPCDPITGIPQPFTFQLKDMSTGHTFFDEAVPSVLLANYHTEVLDARVPAQSCFWNLLDAVYPVVGTGLFRAQIQSTAAIGTAPARIEIGVGALEVSPCN
jgi:hypothetical protein